MGLFGGKNSFFRKPLGTGKKSVSKVVNNTVKATKKAVSDTTEVAKAVAGTAVRDQANVFTAGLSESFGVGEAIQGKFGGNKSIRNASSVWNTVNSMGRKTGLAVGTAGLTTKLTGPEQPEQVIQYISGGNDLDFLGNLGKVVEGEATNWAKNQIGNLFNPRGSTAKNSPTPLTSNTATVSSTGSNNLNNGLIFGAVGVGLFLLMFLVLKRK